MASAGRNITFEQRLLIAVISVFPIWIAGDYVLDFASQQSCGRHFLDVLCEYHDPARRAILPSLTAFHFAVVVGSLVSVLFIYRGLLLVSLTVSLIVFGFFADFVIDYIVFAGDAQCTFLANQSCGPSPLFLSLFLESYDKALLAFMPVQLLWIGRLLFQRARQKTRLT